jgi:hypothetical protein
MSANKSKEKSSQIIAREKGLYTFYTETVYIKKD